MMSTLEFQKKYNLTKVELQSLSNEQILEFIELKEKERADIGIALQAAGHTLNERGQSRKIKVRDTDLHYVPNPEIPELPRKTKETIRKEEIRKLMSEIDFSDI